MTKKEYRTQLIKLRKQETEKEAKSEKIAKEVLSFCDSYSVIGVYLSLEDEVQTDELIRELLAKNKVVVFPKVFGDDLKFFRSDKFEKSKFGVREPVDGEEYSCKTKLHTSRKPESDTIVYYKTDDPSKCITSYELTNYDVFYVIIGFGVLIAIISSFSMWRITKKMNEL